MPNRSNLITLRRPLLSPEPSTLEPLQSALIKTTQEYMPVTPDHVLFLRSDMGALSILGGNIIEETTKYSETWSELPYLSYPEIATRIYDRLTS